MMVNKSSNGAPASGYGIKSPKKTALIFTASVLAMALTVFSGTASAGTANTAALIAEARPAAAINPGSSSTLTRAELESIIARVISLDINVDKEQKSYIVRALGSLTNRSNLILKNIRLTVQLMDVNKNLIEEIPLDYIDRADPGEEKAFKIEKYINTKSSPYDIRAKATIAEAEKTDTMQIAQWFLDGRKEMLKYWNVPFEEKDFQNGSMLRDSAIRVLYGVRPDDINYPKANEMINELRYTEGLLNISAADYENAFINLIAVNPAHKFADKSQKLIELYRPQTVFEKAKALYPAKDYINALFLMRTIPPNNELYFEAQREIKKLISLTKTSILKRPMPARDGYSDDQARVLQLMENKPEVILNDSPSKSHTIWVFSDFSHFNFDEKGKLTSYRVYPLY